MSIVTLSARQLTDRIKEMGAELHSLLAQAYETAAWLELGYSSWLEYCREEFSATQLRLPGGDRERVIAALVDVGMSQREIAAATGVGKRTVARSISGSDDPGDDLDPEPDIDAPPPTPAERKAAEAEQRQRDQDAADGRDADRVRKFIDGWLTVEHLASHKRRDAIRAKLIDSDRARLDRIAEAISWPV